MTDETGLDSPPSQGQRATQISNAVVRIQREYIGRGPTRARTSIQEDTVLVVLQDTMTKAERTLAAEGRDEQVLQMRRSFQRVMGPPMVRAVEEALGRTVLAFMSDNHMQPDIACEIFILAPTDADAPGDDAAVVVEGDDPD